jgi:hypothetical protein
MDKHIFAAIFALDKAKAFLTVEEFDHAFALANNLGWHSAAITAAAAATWAAKAAATACAATTAWAAEAAATAARGTKATAAAAKAISTATKAITAAGTSHEWVETFFAKTVALVSAFAATSSIKTHKTERTFASPHYTMCGNVDETWRTARKSARKTRNLLLRIFAHI